MCASGIEGRSGSGPASVVAIGVFDGVHRGHRGLIDQARRLADDRGLVLIALTFDPHPASVIPGRQAPAALASLDERIALLEAAGADEVVVLAFDRALAAMEPAEFVDRVLVDRLQARAVVVGENFRFGRGASGDVLALTQLGAERGIDVTAVALHPKGAPWSSSRVRAALAAGDVATAAEVLGRPYRLQGTVVHGDHRGRELGYPTANLAWAGDPAVPQDGVYAGWLLVDQGRRTLPAAISVGTNPQFDGQQRRVEAHVIGQDGLDLYGQLVAVDFQEHLRPQLRFDSVAELVTQMGQDVERSRVLLARGAG